MSDIKTEYGTAATGNGGITSLASSATWLAGYEWFISDNTTDKALDRQIQGNIRLGTSPTANTEIRIYAVASVDGTTWPDVIDGTPSAETWTSEGVREGAAVCVKRIIVDSTTSNRDYPFFFELAAFMGGSLPKKTAIFVTHNTGVALNSTGSTHTYIDMPTWGTVS